MTTTHDGVRELHPCSLFPARLLMVLAVLLLASGCSTLRGTPTRYQSTSEVVSTINLVPQDLADLQAATSEVDRNHL